MVETSRKALTPHKGAAALAIASHNPHAYYHHEPPPTYQPPVLHSPELNELNMNKGVSLM